MAVRIRMTRMGRRHRPFFRINVVDAKSPRDGRVLEKLGHYDPLVKDADKQIVLDLERAKFWLEQGAVPSDTVSDMLVKLGVPHKYAEEKAARRAKAKAIAKGKNKLFDKAAKVADQKRRDAEKAAKEAAAKEAEEKAKAEAAAKEAEEKAKAEAENAEGGEG